MRLVTFTLLVATENNPEVESVIHINPEHAETAIDGTPFQKGLKVTQIRMISGTSFFVKQSVNEVKAILLGVE